MAHREVVTSIQKQTKNRNETGSNLSLGTRLTVLSKRLGRKRCCDTTPDRCQECSRLTVLHRIVLKMKIVILKSEPSKIFQKKLKKSF